MPFRLRKALAAATAILLLFAAGCTGAPAPASGQSALSVPSGLPVAGAVQGHVFFTVPTLSHPLAQGLARGLQDSCDERGLAFTIHDAGNDAATQCQALAESGGTADVIFCLPVNAEMLAPYVDAARAKGAVVVALAATLAGADDSLPLDGDACGRTLVQQAVAPWLQAAGRTRAVVAILQRSGRTTPAGVAAAMAAALQEALPGATVVQKTVAFGDDGTAAMEELLREHRSLSVVLAEDDALALAALAAVFDGEDAPRADNWYFASVGGGEDARAALAAGGAFRATLSLETYENGTTLAAFAHGLATGQAPAAPTLATQLLLQPDEDEAGA